MRGDRSSTAVVDDLLDELDELLDTASPEPRHKQASRSSNPADDIDSLLSDLGSGGRGNPQPGSALSPARRMERAPAPAADDVPETQCAPRRCPCLPTVSHGFKPA